MVTTPVEKQKKTTQKKVTRQDIYKKIDNLEENIKNEKDIRDLLFYLDKYKIRLSLEAVSVEKNPRSFLEKLRKMVSTQTHEVVLYLCCNDKRRVRINRLSANVLYMIFLYQIETQLNLIQVYNNAIYMAHNPYREDSKTYYNISIMNMLDYYENIFELTKMFSINEQHFICFFNATETFINKYYDKIKDNRVNKNILRSINFVKKRFNTSIIEAGNIFETKSNGSFFKLSYAWFYLFFKQEDSTKTDKFHWYKKDGSKFIEKQIQNSDLAA